MKLDLHTHCFEATCIYRPTRESVGRIVAAARARGLDGIAVTEHYNRDYGFRVRDMVEEHFPGQLLIIPGEEIDQGNLHVVVLCLPGDLTFRFVAHPGYPRGGDFAAGIDASLHGIEIRNPTHDDEMDREAILRAAEEHNLLLLQNSDAHFLSDIGKHYNEITIEELCARAS